MLNYSSFILPNTTTTPANTTEFQSSGFDLSIFQTRRIFEILLIGLVLGIPIASILLCARKQYKAHLSLNRELIVRAPVRNITDQSSISSQTNIIPNINSDPNVLSRYVINTIEN